MANTTNFGWETPDDTDLVKDGAAAMRTLGNAIDTSFVDLKGGTTGQILSKASNTDLDYTWITNEVGDITEVIAGTGLSGGGTTGAVTLTNTVATAFDAKGDLIAGTGADTFSKLTIGADYGFLQALASESTGMKWDSAGWTSWTPTITANSGSFTTVSSTGTYKRIGKTCFVRQTITITTNGTAAGTVNSTLPFTGVSSSFTGVFRENQSTGLLGQISIESSTAVFRKSDNSYPGGSNYRFEASYFYEVA